MSENKPHKKRRYRGWIIAAILLFILLFSGRLLLKSDWLFEKVRGIAEEQINQQLNGNLSVNKIEGDLLSGFTVRNIALDDSLSENIATVDSVKIQYDLFSVLFSPHTIESVELFGSNIFVEQQADSSWNVLNLIPEKDETVTESEPLYWYVENISLTGTNIEIHSEQYLPDDRLFVDDISARLSAGILESGISGNLRDLGFSIREGRLPQPVDIYLAGAAQEGRYTLDSIVINTGRSVLRGSARYGEDGEIEQEAELSPLSWRDIAEYSAEAPIEQNLEIELGATGTLENLEFDVDASGNGLQRFHIQAIASLQESMSLQELRVEFEELDGPLLTGLENTPYIQSLNFWGEGLMLLDSFDDSEWQGSLDIVNTEYQKYGVDQLSMAYSLENGELNMDGTLAYQNEEISIAAEIDSLFGSQPGWKFYINSGQFNPGLWLQDQTYAGNLDIKIDAMGMGFDPQNFSGSSDIIISGSEIYSQQFSSFSFAGSIDQNQVHGRLSGQLQESSAIMDFSIKDWQSLPEYEFNLEMSRMNLAELNGLGDFPTFLNGTVEGSGTSFDPEQMTIMATANFDSSIVNGEEIEELSTDFKIEDQFVIVDDGSLVSSIADASFTLDHHLFELTNSANRLNFVANLKDLQPLAPLFAIETLESEGTISGNLGRKAGGMLEFNGDLNLENVAVDTLFTARQISGRMVSYILDDPEVDLNVKLSEPAVYQKSVQDMQVYMYAKKRDLLTEGNLSLTITNGNDSSLKHSGTFMVDSTKSTLTTNEVSFQTQLRELNLENPFNINYSNNMLQVDTLTISTDNGEAYLEFWAPRIDSLYQQAGLSAQNLNIGVLQETILKESYFNGYLNGSISVDNSPDHLEASMTGNLTELNLYGGEMDSLNINMDIKDEWLTASLESWNQSRQLAEGSLRVPYLPGDPLTFDDQFFEHQIEGEFNVNESQLSYWLSFLPEGNPQQTEGTVSLESSLGGIAGSPDLEGHFNISSGLFSGIRVDTVGMDIAYLHENEHIKFSGSIVRDQREILDFDADLPFLVDLKRAEVYIPTGDDEIFVDLKTNNFDLALLNSYVNRELVRGVSGRLEGAVTLTGAMNNLQAEGDMQLAKGSMRIVPAGITLSEISSNLLFKRETVDLQQFTARSGPGSLKANGRVRMQGLEPEEVDITIMANQFSLLNTSDYRAIINMNATMSGMATAPMLKGQLTFLNGFYYLQDFGETSVESVELDNPNQEELSSEIFDALEMEMTIGFDREFFIRNRQYLDMEVELGGEVDLVKQPEQDLQMFGSLEGVDGYARPLGKEFELEEALVSFYGPVNNPELQIRSRYTPPQAAGVQIFYIIEGTLEEPEFRFDSQPELELQDIISYTLFGRPFYELESWEQVVAGSSNSPSAADFALEVVLDRVEMLASRRLGIDVVEIDNSQSGSNNTVIKTGWYLNPSTFFAILNEIDGTSPKTLFTLEIMLRENLELIITQGDDTRQGIDLQWKKDY
ncbi:MAG: translocation/assembly module TamB domain-containing protein [Balneolaceae bacterium]|nr:translocation/assembly module TamB domain-containing protein [Balneolaceae bacterium]